MAEIIRSMNLVSVFKQEKGVKRFFMMIFSILLMGFGISLFSYSDMGVDPFTSMNMAISGKIGISFGFYQMCINCVILIAIAFLGRHLIGFGTVVNMVGVGYICEFFTSLYDAHLPVEKSLALRLVLMLFGVIFLSLAASMYFTSNLGVAPYDTTGFVLDDRTKIKYKWCRVITDLICTAVGFAFGGPVGIGTVVTAFMMGPVVAFFNKHVSEKLLAAKMPRLVVRVYDLRRFGGGVISSNGKFAA